MSEPSIPPRLLVALALVGAVGLIVLAEVLTMAAASAPGLGATAEIGLLDRVRLGTRLIDLPLLTIVPLAVLLARLVEPGAPRAHEAATRAVLSGGSAVGTSLVLLVVVRLLADLGGQGAFIDPRPTLAALVVNLASLLVAGAGAAWAYRELQRTPRPDTVAPPGPPPPPPPPTWPPPGPGGFPIAPPPAAPPRERGSGTG